MQQQQAIIIGAGPAGLTAAYELLQRTSIRPIVIERSDYMGGIARTVNYKGNRIDIGGHRFFSKSDRVMDWWLEMLPLEALDTGGHAVVEGNGQAAQIAYQGKRRDLVAGVGGPDPDEVAEVMLLRSRKSRIYFARRFFPYPITLSLEVLRKLGLARSARIGFSYLKSLAFPRRPETSLEDFLINRFGRELYETFFKSYTEKVWGVPCHEISAEWGAQRIKGLSITKAVMHALKRMVPAGTDIAQKGTETSLIERFLYPKYGPGQMWETCAERVRALGGEILTEHEVERLDVETLPGGGQRVAGVAARDRPSGELREFTGDYVFSTMPVRNLVQSLNTTVPPNVKRVSEGLVYRDFITVGLLVEGLKVKDGTAPGRKLIQDNWIYIQEPDVQVGRLQIFNNWSPYLVDDPDKVWIGLEYFCNDTDDLWRLPDSEMADLAVRELDRIGILDRNAVLDSVVIRMEKTYPAYIGAYDEFDVVRNYIDGYENLFLVGRNGMHRYNNQDHSMLTAMVAVDNIAAGITSKDNIWDVNTEEEYHEQHAEADRAAPSEPTAVAARSG